jgi:Uma2 family endonuclease
MASQPQAKYWTYEDLFNLPDDGKRYEIIEGVLYELPAPGLEHAVLIANLIEFVFGPAGWALGGKILTAPVDVFLRGANPVQPDLLVLLPEQLGQMVKRGVEGPPALVAEILSPGNSRHDLITKRAIYARAGVQEYWLVSPEAMIVEILKLEGEQYRTHARVARDEILTSAIFPSFSCPAASIFES